MTRIRRRERDERMRSIEQTLDRIWTATIVRDPGISKVADAYDGLRKQVIAAVNERTAHLQQLAKFDAALRAKASHDELADLVREWMAQASLEVVMDPRMNGAFEIVGSRQGAELLIRRPAYVDGVSGRVVRGGIAAYEDPPAPQPVAASGADGSSSAAQGSSEPDPSHAANETEGDVQ